MSYDTDALSKALVKIDAITDTHDAVLKGQIAIAVASLRNIMLDMDRLIADCERLRRELDDEMGIMR